jgi:citrate lyase alpha subunit
MRENLAVLLEQNVIRYPNAPVIILESKKDKVVMAWLAYGWPLLRL